MSTNVLTVTEMVRHFSDYISRVAYRNETFILRKGNNPMAEIRPVLDGIRLGDLPSMLNSIPHLSEDEVHAFAGDIESARLMSSGEMARDPWGY